MPVADSAVARPIVRLYHRPGSVQTEIRIGHVGLPRRVPDFHAVQVMAAILGGLFNSRLQMNLREDKGYTYGVGAGFDMRRGAGPFARPDCGPDRGHRAGHLRSAQRAAPDARHGWLPRPSWRWLATTWSASSRCASRRPARSSGRSAGSSSNGLPDDELARYRGLSRGRHGARRPEGGAGPHPSGPAGHRPGRRRGRRWRRARGRELGRAGGDPRGAAGRVEAGAAGDEEGE